MHKQILGGLAVAAIVAGGLATTSGMAQAIVQDEGPAACYVQVPFQEYQYSKTVPGQFHEAVTHKEYKFERTVNSYGDVIAKETRTREWVAGTEGTQGIWQNFSPNKDQGTFEGPPSWPSDPRGTWNHQDKDIPGGHQGPDGVYQKGQGNGSWFYRQAGIAGTDGSWGGWGPWTDWPYAGPVNDDGRDRGPLPHGSGPGWEREYRYVVVDQYVTGSTVEKSGWVTEKPVGEGWERVKKRTVIDTGAYTDPDTVVLYKDGAWTTDTPGEPWVKIAERMSYENGDQIPCSEQPKDDFDVRTDNGTCESGDDLVTVTRYRTNFTYALDGNFEWVRTQDGDEFIASQTERELSEGEQEACVPPADDPSVTRTDVGEPVCDTTTTKVTVATITYTPEYIEGAWVQVASDPVVTEEVRNLTVGEQFRCPITPTVVEQLPPPAAPVVPVVVAVNSPAQAPTTSAPAGSAGSLPATGSNGTGMTALLALLATSLGGVGLLVARRRDATT